MKMTRILVGLMVLLSACSEQRTPEIEMTTFNIDAGRISVAGISSGAYMAGQLHIAHSQLFGGLGMLGGGPYYCAQGDLARGLGVCMKGGDVEQDALLEIVNTLAAEGGIDALQNLEDDPIWLFHGLLDGVVAKDLTLAAAAMYSALDVREVVSVVDTVNVVHGLPTIATGVACDTFGTPFIHACDYDAAGEMLQVLYGELEARTAAVGELKSIEQPGATEAEMLEHAFLYVPASCAAGERCGVHVVLHGCTQSSEFLGDVFATGAGFNEWAESNRLLVLYPQAGSSKIAPMNPYGCWDWWGYTNADYATRKGPQIQVIKATLDAMAGRTL